MAEPLNRRAVIGALLVVPATAAVASVPGESDAEIIALSAEIVRRADEAERFQAARVDPYAETFKKLLRARPFGKSRDSIFEEALAYSRKSGRDAAIEALQDFDLATDALFDRMLSIPATTKQGRAAKVRALFAHVVRDEKWHRADDDTDYDVQMIKALFGEFSGLRPEELVAAEPRPGGGV